MAGKGALFTSLTELERKRIEYIVSDVDDTITTNGKLLASTLEALWKLHASGRKIILITGGSAGWADVYIRQWPVDYVIAESGALLLSLSNNASVDSEPIAKPGRSNEVLCTSKASAFDIVYDVNPMIDIEKATAFRNELLREASGYALSSDQYARIYDIAYDKSRNSVDSIDRVKAIVASLGGNYAESSIHLNCWYGDYDKKKGLLAFLDKITSKSIDEFISSAIYLGDSLNDQILFDLFELSIGMHSVADRRDEFKALPAFITKEYGGFGFSAVVDALLK